MHLSSFSIKRDKCLTLLFCYSILFCVSHEVGPKSIILLPVFLSEYSILSTFFHINQCNSLASFLIVGCIVFYFMDITIHVTKLCFGKLSYSQTFCSQFCEILSYILNSFLGIRSQKWKLQGSLGRQLQIRSPISSLLVGPLGY